MRTQLRKFIVWTSCIAVALGLSIGGILSLLIVFDEMAYWRTLLRQGQYQKLDSIFSELETEAINPFKPLAWIFSREIHKRFPNFSEVQEGLSFSVFEKRAFSCEQARAGNQKLAISQLQKIESGIYLSDSIENLCEVEYRLKNAAFGLNVIMGVSEISKSDNRLRELKTGEYRFIKSGGKEAFSIDLNDASVSSKIYQIFAIAGQRQRIGSIEWIKTAIQEDEMKNLIDRAKRLGLIIIIARHKIKK